MFRRKTDWDRKTAEYIIENLREQEKQLRAQLVQQSAEAERIIAELRQELSDARR